MVVSMSKQEFSRLDLLLRVQSGRLRVSDACVLIAPDAYPVESGHSIAGIRSRPASNLIVEPEKASPIGPHDRQGVARGTSPPPR